MSQKETVERAHLTIDFLAKNGWGKATRFPLSGDASFRRYERLKLNGKTMMLMDAPPPQEDVNPFIYIDEYLRDIDLSAPEIFAKDIKNGFLLLEDLGDDIFTEVLSGKSPLSNKCNEKDLYIAAVDALVELQNALLPKNLPPYNEKLLMDECKLLSDWYLPHIGIKSKHAGEEYLSIWEQLLKLEKIADDVVVLRDYHADNLLWLPGRKGVKKVGLLDFQDAVIGSPVYDIVSLLEDARRDVDLITVSATIDHYLNLRPSIQRDEFIAAYSILAAQRNCKIVGIFTRLAFRDNKPRYLSYLPRVWKYIMYDVQHPVLKDLKQWFEKEIPEDKRKPEAFDLSQFEGKT